MLVDWGFSLVTTRLDQDDVGLVGATPLYTAPEVVLNRNYNGELADLYSIEATRYVLLTGRAPYDDVDLEVKPKAIARQIKTGRVECTYLGVLLPELTHDVVMIVHALVSPEPFATHR